MDSLVETTETARGNAKSIADTDAAFASLYEQHARALYYLALRFLGDPTQAEDVTHDVFVKAFRHWDQFRHEAQPKTWLYRIAINHCRNVVNSWAHRNFTSLDEENRPEEPSPSAEQPFRILEVQELGRRIQTTLNALPEEYRLLLLLIADENMSYQEVADLTGQTIDAIRGKLHRARRAFIQKFRSTE